MFSAVALTVLFGCSGAISSLAVPAARDDVALRTIVRKRVPVPYPARVLNVWQGYSQPARKSFVVSPRATGTFIYACAYDADACVWYAKGHRQIAGEIAGLHNPEGIGVNPINGNVYIADTGGSDILVYPPNSTTLLADYPDPGEYPADVAVDRDGAFYVANIFGLSGGNGSVTVYDSSGNIVRTLGISFDDTGTSVTVDEHHLVVFCTHVETCVQFVGAREPGVQIIGFAGFPGGSSFDDAEDLVVVDQVFDQFYTFKDDQQCGLAKLESTGDPVMMALGRENRTIYIADALNGVVGQYPFTDCDNSSGIFPEHIYKQGLGPTSLLVGTAVTPGVGP